MYCWRVTKYNPIYRDEKGAYLKDEWTSISDVGREYEGSILTMDEYLRVEDKYVQAIIDFMECSGVQSLIVEKLWKRRRRFRRQSTCIANIKKAIRRIKEGSPCDRERVQGLARLILRQELWCKLWCESKMFVHFGYDYYMYIGSCNKCEDAIQKTELNGLYVEEHESPYLNQP